jgi:hypothetical protein
VRDTIIHRRVCEAPTYFHFTGRLEFVRPAGSGWQRRHELRRRYRLSCGELMADTCGWEWVDMDGNRLLWAAKGCLWAGMLHKDGIQHGGCTISMECSSRHWPRRTGVVGQFGKYRCRVHQLE